MSKLNITPDPAGDTQEHINAMVAKADGVEVTPEAPEGTPERPEWLPEKFKSPEDMVKAYAALEAKMGGKEAPKDEGAGEAQEVTPDEAQEVAEKAVEKAGLDMDSLGEKIAKGGDIDESDYEALAKAGISRDMVKSFVAGQQALAQQMVTRMYETVGGEETFNNILEWASENLPTEDIEAFNQTVDTGSEATVRLALEGLHAKFKAGGNNRPKLLAGGKATGNGDVFRSVSELTRAMNDPRYVSDPAFRADVAAKLDRSSII